MPSALVRVVVPGRRGVDRDKVQALALLTSILLVVIALLAGQPPISQ